MKKILIFLAAFLFFVPAMAQDSLFCPALDRDATYDGKYDSYRKLISGKDGWIFRSVSDFKIDFEIKDQDARALLSFQKALAAKGATLVLLYVPTRGMTNPQEAGFEGAPQAWKSYAAALEKMRALGVNAVGVEEPFAGNGFFQPQDHHWTVAGAKIAAQALARAVKAMPVYAALEKRDFVTSPAGEKFYQSAFAKIFKSACGSEMKPVRVAAQETAPAQEAADAGDLFSDQTPQAVLSGTSNSIPEVYANFDGALKEALSADVLNVSAAGAGVDGPMLAYLNSDHYRSGKARLIVWEVPGYYGFDRLRRFLRQAAPSAAGFCADPAEKVEREAGPGTQALFENIPLEGKKYLAIKFSAPVRKPFDVVFVYPGREERFHPIVKPRVGAQNEFFVALPNKKEALQSIELILPPDSKKTQVLAELCPFEKE